MTSMPVETIPAGALRYSPVQVGGLMAGRVIYVLCEGEELKVDLRSVFGALNVAWRTGKTCALMHEKQFEISKCNDRNGPDTLLIDAANLVSLLARCVAAAHSKAQERMKAFILRWPRVVSEKYPDYASVATIRSTKITPEKAARVQKKVAGGMTVAAAAKQEQISNRAGYAIAKGTYHNRALAASKAFAPQTGQPAIGKKRKQAKTQSIQATLRALPQRAPKRRIASTAELQEEIPMLVAQHPDGVYGVAGDFGVFPAVIYRLVRGQYKDSPTLVERYNWVLARVGGLGTNSEVAAA